MTDYLYAVLCEDPAVLKKIDISDMSVDGTWTGSEAYEEDAEHIIGDGTYIYLVPSHPIAGHTDVAYILKIRQSDMSKVDELSTDPADDEWTFYGLAIDSDYEHIFAGFNGSALSTPVILRRYDTSDMGGETEWNAANVWQCDMYEVLYHNDAVYTSESVDYYAVMDTAAVHRINPDTMATTHTWTEEITEDQYFREYFGLCAYGDYVYVSAVDYEGLCIIKLSADDLTEEDRWSYALASPYWSDFPICTDGEYVYAGCELDGDESPGLVLKIDCDTMELSDSLVTSNSYYYCYAVEQDDDYIYAGLTSDHVLKIAKSTMSIADSVDLEGDVYDLCWAEAFSGSGAYRIRVRAVDVFGQAGPWSSFSEEVTLEL